MLALLRRRSQEILLWILPLSYSSSIWWIHCWNKLMLRIALMFLIPNTNRSETVLFHWKVNNSFLLKLLFLQSIKPSDRKRTVSILNRNQKATLPLLETNNKTYSTLLIGSTGSNFGSKWSKTANTKTQTTWLQP